MTIMPNRCNNTKTHPSQPKHKAFFSVPVRVEEIFIDTQEVCIANAHQLDSSFVLVGLLSSQVDVAEPGDNVRMKVKGIEEEDLRYGFVMCQKDSVVQGCRYFDAKVNILEYKSIICPGYISVMHIHAATEEVAIMHLLATLDKKGQVLEKKPKFVKQGQVGRLFESSALRCVAFFLMLEIALVLVTLPPLICVPIAIFACFCKTNTLFV